MKLYLILLIIGAIALVTVSEMDFEDAINQESHYTAMVCAGAWPDYENLKPDCGG